MSRQERQHTLPVVGWAKAKAKQVLILRQCSFLVGEAPNLSWRSMIGLADARVESPYAAESGSKGNLDHRQTGFIDQFLREVQTVGVRYGAGCRAQMFEKQPAKVARSDSKAFRQAFDSAVLQTALSDQP